MIAEIITIGDEILIGQTIDTNSAWMGKKLNVIGIAVHNIQSIQDERESIVSALKLASGRADLILMTGGLGPTQDDITKQVLCDYFETELEMDEEVLSRINAFFKSRGREMLESNVQQAALPKSCVVLENKFGTASGMWFEKDSKVFVSMPGVPYEMKGLMKDEVIPRIKKGFQLPVIMHKTIMTEGIGESFLVEIIKEWEGSLNEANIKIAYLPSPGIVKIRLSLFGQGQDRNQMESLVQSKIDELKKLVSTYIFAEKDIKLENAVAQLLLENQLSIATAESCTGGFLAHLLTSIPGSSNYFQGSVIAYSNQVKVDFLGVQEMDLSTKGAVSSEVVEAMATGARNKFNTDFALATSGVAGPDGGTEDKPVGTVWIAIAYSGGVYSKKYLFEQNRNRNIKRASYAALSLVKRKVLGQLD